MTSATCAGQTGWRHTLPAATHTHALHDRCTVKRTHEQTTRVGVQSIALRSTARCVTRQRHTLREQMRAQYNNNRGERTRSGVTSATCAGQTGWRHTLPAATHTHALHDRCTVKRTHEQTTRVGVQSIALRSTARCVTRQRHTLREQMRAQTTTTKQPACPKLMCKIDTNTRKIDSGTGATGARDA